MQFCALGCLVLVMQGEPQSPAPLLKKAMREYEVNPQRNRYVMERLIGDYFEEEKGKRGGETESYSLNETEKEGAKERVVRTSE